MELDFDNYLVPNKHLELNHKWQNQQIHKHYKNHESANHSYMCTRKIIKVTSNCINATLRFHRVDVRSDPSKRRLRMKESKYDCANYRELLHMHKQIENGCMYDDDNMVDTNITYDKASSCTLNDFLPFRSADEQLWSKKHKKQKNTIRKKNKNKNKKSVSLSTNSRPSKSIHRYNDNNTDMQLDFESYWKSCKAFHDKMTRLQQSRLKKSAKAKILRKRKANAGRKPVCEVWKDKKRNRITVKVSILLKDINPRFSQTRLLSNMNMESFDYRKYKILFRRWLKRTDTCDVDPWHRSLKTWNSSFFPFEQRTGAFYALQYELYQCTLQMFDAERGLASDIVSFRCPLNTNKNWRYRDRHRERVRMIVPVCINNGSMHNNARVGTSLLSDNSLLFRIAQHCLDVKLNQEIFHFSEKEPIWKLKMNSNSKCIDFKYGRSQFTPMFEMNLEHILYSYLPSSDILHSILFAYVGYYRMKYVTLSTSLSCGHLKLAEAHARNHWKDALLACGPAKSYHLELKNNLNVGSEIKTFRFLNPFNGYTIVTHHGTALYCGFQWKFMQYEHDRQLHIRHQEELAERKRKLEERIQRERRERERREELYGYSSAPDPILFSSHSSDFSSRF